MGEPIEHVHLDVGGHCGLPIPRGQASPRAGLTVTRPRWRETGLRFNLCGPDPRGPFEGRLLDARARRVERWPVSVAGAAGVGW